ncbi:MAG: ATP-binding protein [Nitriliruptoraceae bacterium]
MGRQVPGTAAAIAVLVLLVPALVLAVSLRRTEEAQVERRLASTAEGVASLLEGELRRIQDLGTDIAISTTLVDALDSGAYQMLLERYGLMERFPGLNGVTYVERVTARQAAALLDQRASGGPRLELAEPAGEALVRLATLSYPLDRNRAVLGVDLTSRPESRAAHDTAHRTGDPTLSDLTQIVQLLPGEPGASLHLPVPGSDPPATLGMVFSVARLFEELTPRPADVELRLRDPDSGVFPDPVVLPAGGPRLDRSAQAGAAVAGQVWVVEAVATQGYVQPLLRRGSTLLALGGTVAAMLVGLLVFTLATREQHARGLVAERTVQLREANADLAGLNQELATANSQLELADQDKDEFLAAVSHELRTPLTVIAGFVESVRWQRPTGEELDAMLLPIDRNVRRLDLLVSDLLTLVSLDAGALTSRPEPVPLRHLLARAPGELAGLPAEWVEVEVEGEPVASVDPSHLERIVVNLLTNAERHGAPPIVLRARRCPDEAFVELTVRDHGAGIPAEEAEIVFERFTRAPGKPAVNGTGLGLAIVRELATLNGGVIRYLGAQPGACFVVRLPAAAEDRATTLP